MRVWAIVLVAVNALALCFIDTIYAQVALAAVGLGVVVMALIYQRIGFVRLLGIGHALWLVMLPWMVTELPKLDPGSWLYRWMVCLIALNSISLTIDISDVIRFWKGDRKPHYVWNRRDAAS